MKQSVFLCVFFASFFINKGVLYSQTGEFDWVKQSGSGNNEEGTSISVDHNGNVYSTGYFEGIVDFDPGTGVSNLASLGGRDIFIQKLDSDGNFVWAIRLGGTSNDVGVSLTTDNSGNVYTAGYFEETVDFDPGTSIQNLVSEGNADIFILKLNPNGDFVWANRNGGVGVDQSLSILIDSHDNLYSAGVFSDIADFSGVSLTSLGGLDAYIQKLDLDGNHLWVKQMGGIDQDFAVDIASDSHANVYTTGSFTNTVDFNPGSGTSNLVSDGLADVFIQKLDTAGNFIWAKKIGGSGNDQGLSIQTDHLGNIISAGVFQNTVDFNPGNGISNLSAAGYDDVFIQKMDSTGNFIWAKKIGGVSHDRLKSVIVDQIGNIYSTGYFSQTVDFDPGTGTFNLTSISNFDGFIQKMDPNGNFILAKKIGSDGVDQVSAIDLDHLGNIYTTGYFSQTVDFDPGAGTFNLTSFGLNDHFVLKLTTTLGTADSEPVILSVFPNPTSDCLFITLNEEFDGTILDISGKIIQEFHLKAGTAVLNTDMLNPGIYFIQSGNTKPVQFMKQ